MEATEISWCDGTLNFWEGCTKISDGCKFCYALDRDIRWNGGKHWGPGAPRRKSKSAINDARKYSQKAEKGFFVRCIETGARGWLGSDQLPADTVKAIARPKFFSLSLGDILDDEIDPLWLAEALNAAMTATGIDFMFLTKRPGAWREMMDRAYLAAAKHLGDAVADRLKYWITGERIPFNIAWGATVENERNSYRIAELLAIPVERRFLSMEPLLGSVDWFIDAAHLIAEIDLVIVGGESGNQARPMFIGWPLEIERVCDRVGTAFHFKQWGEWVPIFVHPFPAGKPVIGNMLRVQDTGTSHGPGAFIQGPNATVWRAGKKTAGYGLPDADGCTRTGLRTRREMLTFPGDSNRQDWHYFAGNGVLPARMLASRQEAADFINAYPAAADKIKRWDGPFFRPRKPQHIRFGIK